MRYPNFRKLLNPKPYRSLIGAFIGTLIDPFKGTPNFRKLPILQRRAQTTSLVAGRMAWKLKGLMVVRRALGSEGHGS